MVVVAVKECIFEQNSENEIFIHPCVLFTNLGLCTIGKVCAKNAETPKSLL